VAQTFVPAGFAHKPAEKQWNLPSSAYARIYSELLAQDGRKGSGLGGAFFYCSSTGGGVQKRSMPWYVALLLFLLAPVYTIVVRERLWPKVQDWWAGRSIRTIQRQIDSLKASIGRNPSISDFLVFLATRTFLILCLLACNVVWLSSVSDRLVPFLPSTRPVPLSSNYAVIQSIKVLYFLIITLPGYIALVSYRQSRRYFPKTYADWVQYKQRLQLRILLLQRDLDLKLKEGSAQAGK
jgi:hypothetical protein